VQSFNCSFLLGGEGVFVAADRDIRWDGRAARRPRATSRSDRLAFAADLLRSIWLLRRDANLGNRRCYLGRLVDTGSDMTSKRSAAVTQNLSPGSL
jgi:hypothetical protein